MTLLPKHRNTGANLQEFYRVGLANGSNFMGFPLTGRWQSALVQAWWKFLKQEALVKLSVLPDFRLSSKCFGTGPFSFRNCLPNQLASCERPHQGKLRPDQSNLGWLQDVLQDQSFRQPLGQEYGH